MKKRSLFTLTAALIAATLTLVGCGKEQAAQLKPLVVEISYRERIMLPPTATVTVTLEDVSRQDVAAVVLDKQTVKADKAPPYRVELSYDPESIKDGMNYALRARIENDGKLLFTNTSRVDAFAGEPGKPVQIMVQNVARASTVQNSQTERAPEILIEGDWQLVRIENNTEVQAGDQQPLTLSIAEGKVNGFAGCNHFMGGYTLSGQSIQLGPLAATQKLCIDDSQKLENSYLKALDKVRGYSVKRGSLLFTDDSGLPLMEFAAAPQA